MTMTLKKLFSPVLHFIDSDYFPGGADSVRSQPEKFEISRAVPFIILHLGCLGVIWTGWSWTAVGVAAVLYVVRMFAITALYHRYFCHRAYRTSRVLQFLFGLIGLTAVQRGPLWWASVHRHHHAHSDESVDAHSPVMKGFLWSHIGWLTSSRNFPTDYRVVRDLEKFPELVFLNRFDLIGPLVFHATCAVNSFAHTLGSKRFPTGDESRNSLVLALLTLGEGWHNNHHHYQGAARQGFFWWEIDISYYIIRLMGALGLVWDIKAVPAKVYADTPRREPVTR